MTDRSVNLRWGHVNINVSDLDRAIEFYGWFGFDVFLPGIPYLGLELDTARLLPNDAADVLGVPRGTEGRACILSMGDTFPKLDLTWFALDQTG
ncbi:MAG: hypothetical protein KDI19_16675, partial [Pseudomonadales bacterium]|nr:hypothetical protein [Pseudomonadales bacterium]